MEVINAKLSKTQHMPMASASESNRECVNQFYSVFSPLAIYKFSISHLYDYTMSQANPKRPSFLSEIYQCSLGTHLNTMDLPEPLRDWAGY